MGERIRCDDLTFPLLPTMSLDPGMATSSSAIAQSATTANRAPTANSLVDTPEKEDNLHGRAGR